MRLFLFISSPPNRRTVASSEPPDKMSRFTELYTLTLRLCRRKRAV